MIALPEWHIAVDSDLGLLRIVLVGSFDLETWGAVLAAIPSTPGLRAGMPSVVDARDARLEFLFADAQSLVHVIESYLPRRRGGGFRSAWVVSSDVQYGTSRMVQTVLSELPIESAVFYDLGLADAWATSAARISNDHNVDSP